MEIRTNPLRSARVQAVINRFLQMEYGSTLAHYEIEAIMNHDVENRENILKSSSSGYHSIMQTVKKSLEEQGRTLKNERKVGYKLVKPDDYTEVAKAHVTAAARRIGRAKRVLDNAPEDKMSSEARGVYRSVRDRMTLLAAAMQGARTEIKHLSTKRQKFLEASTNR